MRARLLVLLAVCGCRSIFGLDTPVVAADADLPVACTSDQECMTSSPQHPHCEPTARVCVECITSRDCTSTAEPLCSPTNECVGCIDHAECPSNTCLPSGLCAAEADVIYAAADTGSDAGACSLMAPCKTITHALTLVTGTRRTIKLAGDFKEPVVVQTKVDLIGDPTTSITSTNDPAIKIQAPIGLYNLTVVCAGTNGAGIKLEMTSTLKASEIVVVGCTKPGLDLRSGSAALTRSLIIGNPGGGINVESTVAFSITDCIVARNGGASSNVGGVSIAATAAMLNRFEHNTVADNVIKPGSITAGVHCELANTMVAPNNLIAHNLDSNNAASDVQGCDFTRSRVSPDLTGIAFLNPFQAPFDYHLGTQSTAIDQAVAAPTTIVDLDGDLRPYGTGPDFGADEYRP